MYGLPRGYDQWRTASPYDDERETVTQTRYQASIWEQDKHTNKRYLLETLPAEQTREAAMSAARLYLEDCEAWDENSTLTIRIKVKVEENEDLDQESDDR